MPEIGQVISHYKTIEKLGGGGMAWRHTLESAVTFENLIVFVALGKCILLGLIGYGWRRRHQH